MKPSVRHILVALGTATTLALGAAQPTFSAGRSHGDGASRPVIATEAGAIRGVSASSADQFLGVPYAAPPVRDLRFAAPAEPASWKGVRDADRQSPACVQFEPTGVREEQATSEDCLYLDLYRPKNPGKRSKLPVMVWFHGGGHTQGTGVIYGGSTMASKTDTIVVSVNYRLGALGFLAHPSLSSATPGGSGNYGRMDQIASLEWVRDNVAKFGGDPRNVTIYGQSAGGQAVCDLMAIPSAKGLFHRAIAQSQDCLANRPTLASAEQTGLTYATAVGCPDPATAVACLRKAFPGKLVANQGAYTGSSKSASGLMPVTFAGAVAAGTWNKVPLMTGSTKSENRLLSTALAGITAEGYEQRIRDTYGDRADQVLARYPLSEFKTPYDAITQVQTDAGRACTIERVAETMDSETPTYRYEFDDPTSPTLYGFAIPGEDMSNAHSAELAYLFDFTLGERPLTRTQERLSDQMMRSWGAFARTGNPNVRGAPAWPTYGEERRVMSLRAGGASKAVTTLRADHHCDFWLS
ncbi:MULTISPECIES: carboxylesterase/lipase family protein [Mumia]|uniref:carboxylesterase/lipase family protein n=1 Tax=Mumia TaxID=1546255 RepID=UPI0014214D33|nr:carboxylesterase family protein [Mumia sp. ZJ1417]QMW66743.1 carboxylesterase family protein [Mumia sp. ZJ1417]